MENIVLQDERKEHIKIIGESKPYVVYLYIDVSRGTNVIYRSIVAIIDRTA